MIQFNLLPSVKAEYIKAQRMQRTVMVASALVTAVAVFIFILLLVINVFQKHNLNNLAAQVTQDSAKLQKTANLNQVLTIQNQLESLPSLDSKKVVASRLLGTGGQYGYLGQITPAPVTISDVRIDFAADTLDISGGAPSLDMINTYVDTLKFTTYSTADGKEKNANAFSKVLLTSFSSPNPTATYSITMNFDPNIFSENEAITLTVPDKITTRSVIDQPGASSSSTGQSQPLFQSGSGN